ncbi:formate dehydrogenase [Candidatus Endobugula sertula]|uniref:NADH-quinone oxidoreductase subunit F n=1 Tax=Candidatus Endobugula sertula TaxID=62101 RepID=A0A1D2QP33_9GAMM|nr:formate dehydrogenase [Candidatus Endobugula sertula]
MTIRVYIPRDSSALSMGAEDVAIAMRRAVSDQDVDIVRNGSRGLYWLEPMVEVETPAGRVAYGPVQAKDVIGLIAQGLLQGKQNHRLSLGLTEDIPYLKRQQRLTFARAGIIDPVSLEAYKAMDGYQGLERALQMGDQAIVDEVKASGLRGRGGAAFPTGIKWQTVLDAEAKQKYIVCNADEGDSGTFADRLQMEADPFGLIEGMTIAGLAVGATQGYIYLREEYPHAHDILNEAIARATAQGYLGDNILQSGNGFHLDVRLGAKAYICGEETALLESLEGKRGMVRPKPPIPALEGLFGQPTVVNNVLSLSTVAIILAKGAGFYKGFGMGRSLGTMPFQLAGNIKYAGLVEVALGVTLKELLFDFGGGSLTGRPLRAVQVGGPLGTYLPESQWEVAMDYEAMTTLGAVLGHGGIVAFDDSVDMAEQARFSMAFCVEESCGKCTPCRIGSTRGVEVIDRIRANQDRENNLQLLEELCETMVDSSLCAMGGMTPFPVQSALKHFAEDFAKDPVKDYAN